MSLNFKIIIPFFILIISCDNLQKKRVFTQKNVICAGLPKPIIAINTPMLLSYDIVIQSDSVLIHEFENNKNTYQGPYFIDFISRKLVKVNTYLNNYKTCKIYESEKNIIAENDIGRSNDRVIYNKVYYIEDDSIYNKIEATYEDGGGRGLIPINSLLTIYKKDGTATRILMPYYEWATIKSIAFLNRNIIIISPNLYNHSLYYSNNSNEFKYWLYVFRIEDLLSSCKVKLNHSLKKNSNEIQDDDNPIINYFKNFPDSLTN